MFTRAAYLKVVRAGTWYDLIVSLPYATPLSLALMWQVLDALHARLGLPALPALDAHGVLFADFFGTVVTLWACVRLWRPEIAYGRFDAAGRFAFALWMFVALQAGATPLLWGFMVIELAFGILQSLPVASSRIQAPG